MLHDRMKIESDWTLFLDRDGVINTELPGDYVKHWKDFHFESGVLEAMAMLNKTFRHIVLVTNQRGIGAGLMTEGDLHFIHDKMMEAIHTAGGRIDAIFYCPDEDRTSPHRKPHPYMGLKARERFPDILFQRSVMAGNSLSDMEFGKGLGMHTVFIDDKKALKGIRMPGMDEIYESLLEYAESITRSVVE